MTNLSRLRVLCPACKEGCLALESMTETEVCCAGCKATLPVKGGVIDLLGEAPYRRSLSQAVMEWEPFIRIYESKWFRKSPRASLVIGISFEKEYEMITRAAKLGGDEILLDLGCGTGIYSRPLAQRLNRGVVAGLDLSAPMLNHASSDARAAGLANLLFIRGSALDLPFPDDEFDAVNCCATMHLFSTPDLQRLLTEVSRTLKPGGRFTGSCLRNWIPGKSAKRFLDWYSPKVGTYYRRPEELETLFRQASLTGVECHHARRYWLVMSAVKPI